MSRPLFEDDHEAFRESFRSFLARETEDIFAKAVENGFASTSVPEEQGGAGIDDPRFGVVVAEECALAGKLGLGLVLAAHNAAVDGPADRLVAVAHGTLDRVPGGAWADEVVLIEGDTARRGAITGRDPSAEGFGLEAAGFADLEMEDAEPVAGTFAVDQQLAIAVLALAHARYALGLTVEYVTDRKAFGVPISSFQNTRYELGAVSAEIEAAQAFLDDVVVRDRTPARAAAAKLTATEIQARTVDVGVQFHGGYGYMTEYPIAFAFADARFLRLYGGTSEALKGQLADALGM